MILWYINNVNQLCILYDIALANSWTSSVAACAVIQNDNNCTNCWSCDTKLNPDNEHSTTYVPYEVSVSQNY